MISNIKVLFSKLKCGSWPVASSIMNKLQAFLDGNQNMNERLSIPESKTKTRGPHQFMNRNIETTSITDNSQLKRAIKDNNREAIVASKGMPTIPFDNLY